MLFSESPECTLEPPLRWVGGKRWLVRHIRWYWDRHAQRRLVEPFVGGMAITLGLRPHHMPADCTMAMNRFAAEGVGNKKTRWLRAGVKPGGSAGWQQYSTLYDAVMEQR